MALALVSDVASWIGKDIDAARQGELTSCIAAAQSWIASQAGLRSLEKETTAVTAYIDGKDANGEELWLPSEIRPVWHTGSDLMTVVESGTALTPLAIGYSSTASVVLRGVNSFDRVCLYRVGGWIWNRFTPQNIAVACKVGWHADTGALIVPADVKRLVVEVAWLQFNSFNWVGRQNVSKAGTAITIENDLSPFARAVLDNLRGV
jgi:hypothetical protein